MNADKHADAHAHLDIVNRTAADEPPRGHAVNCPNKGMISLVDCLACRELTELQFDPKTNTTYVDCTPAEPDTK